MWLVLVGAAHAGGPPALEITWNRGRGTARVEAPSGWKVSETAPATLALRWGDRSIRVETDGERLDAGIDVGDVRGTTVEGTLALAMCDLSGTECRPSEWEVRGYVGTSKRGSMSFVATAPELERPFGPTASAAAADQAFAAAKANGHAVLLDFSAAWCPPCNALADEVLEGPPAPELDGYEIAVLDVDNPSSFALKDQYRVGAYPTTLVADADGTEKTRFVGYTTREAFLAWLGGAATSTDAADFAKAPADVTPERAAELGWIRINSGERDLAAPWAERAAAGPDSFAVRRLRFAVHPTVEDLQWLVTNAADHALDFTGSVDELKDQAPELVRQAVEQGLRASRGLDLATALQIAADLASDPAAARALNTAAASIVLGWMTGDPSHDKPYVEELADLQELGGDPDGAVATLRKAQEAWPAEPTFDLALAPLLTRQKRYDEALQSADRALALAWGDNHLRAALAKTSVLTAMGRVDEARQVARDELASQPAPPAGLQVRTFRYRRKLELVVNPEPTP